MLRFPTTVMIPFVLAACLLASPEALASKQDSDLYKNNNDFGLNWKPQPLMRPEPPMLSAPTPAAVQPPPEPPKPDIEAILKPMIPFVSAIEKKLQLAPPEKATTESRLRKLEQVLFGAPMHQDAGELLAKLSDLFPVEAMKAQQELMAEMAKSMPEPKMPLFGDKPAIRLAPGSPSFPGLATGAKPTPTKNNNSVFPYSPPVPAYPAQRSQQPGYQPYWPKSNSSYLPPTGSRSSASALTQASSLYNSFDVSIKN